MPSHLNIRTAVADAALAAAALALAVAATFFERWLIVLMVPLVLALWLSARLREGRLREANAARDAYGATSRLLAEVLRHAEEYPGIYCRDIAPLALAVAHELGLDERRRRNVELAALLHDVGMIALPQEVVTKSGPLDPDEQAVVRRHTIEGERMLDETGGLRPVGAIVRASHERWDGNGYPDALVGVEIPMEARIVAACDAYGAMVTDRPHRAALPSDLALARLADNAGKQFDPQVVDALLRLVPAGPVARPARQYALR